MLPLLLGAGRMLAAGAARGAATGAARGAIVGGIKETVKKGIVDGAKKKATSFIKKKTTKANKKISPDKLIPKGSKGSGTGALVRRKSSAIVRRPTSALVKPVDKETGVEEKQQKEEQKPFDGGDLIKELIAIKETLIKIKGVFGSNLANTLRNQRSQRILRSKEKASKREAELEKKGPEKKGKILEGPKKKLSFFDMIWNYISNVLLGSLANFLFNYVPQIIKMFGEIAKGLENPLQQLRLGIIALTTLFPKQIKFLAKLTGMIIGPPARLIGKLLLKAGGVAKNLFKKAGTLVFNLIKGPLTNLVKRIGGEALEQGIKSTAKGAVKFAGKAAAKAGTAIGTSARFLKRFRAFSKMFKRVPVIGALIGIGIDMAMGEPLDRAIIGAAGASLGSAIGGLIGQGVIPIPGLGALVGAGIGGAIGDWGAKEIYKNLSGRTGPVDKANPIPVERRYAAGRVGGGSRSMPSRTTNIQAKPAVATTKVSADVESKAKEDILKDEKSLNRFKSLSSTFAGTPFIGQLLKMGIDIGMGAQVQKTQTDAAAQDLGFTIGKALEDDEFSVPGLNKRIIGPLSKNLTEWAKKRIFYEVKSREGLFPSIEKSKDQAGKAGEGGQQPATDGGGVNIQGGDADFWTLAAVVSREDGDPQGQADVAQSIYNRLASGAYGGKTIKDLITRTWQYEPTWRYPGGATKGRGNPNPEWFNIKDLASAAAATGTSEFHVSQAAKAILDANLQKNSKEFVQGRTDFTGYAKSARRGQIQRKSGDNYFGWDFNYSGNKIALVPNFNASASSSSGGGGGGKNEPNVAQKDKKIFLHWTAGGYNDNPSGFGYNAVFDGSGKKQQIRPYNQAGEHTWRRNANSVGLAVAAMGGKTDPWSVPPKANQISAMTAEAAKIAKSWGWKASDVNSKNIMTHAEIAKIDGYGPGSGDKQMRWDFLQTEKGKPDWSGGNELRSKIKSSMGGGYGFNHQHIVPSFAMGGNHVVTSSMGMRNFALSPGMHMGVDIAGSTGEPLQAFTDGTVEATSPPSPSAGYGNWVSWIDSNGIGHLYGHMNKPPFVRAGQKVKKGTVLGELGSTGKSSGPHLHWEAATNPQDTGRPKSSVLSRFNPLSRYNKEAPFGGTIKSDGSVPESSGTSSNHDAAPGSTSPGTSSSNQLSFSDSALTSGTIYGDPAKGGGSGTRGKIVEYLTGDPNSPNIAGKAYDRAGHGTPGNYHDHVAFNDRQTAIDAYKFFKSKGVDVTEFKGFGSVGGHAINSYHYSGLAFDIPGYQWGGSGPVGDKDYAGSRKVRALLNEFFGGSIPVGSGPPPSDIAQGSQPNADGSNNGGLQFSESDLTSGTIYGDPSKEFYKKEMANIDQLKQKPSYDQSGKQSIVMLPPMQAQSAPGQSGGGRGISPISGGLNNKEVSALSVRQILASALYKI
jgi:murein DD-endopeptidase MepM/ murein hydrolase activator NlpD